MNHRLRILHLTGSLHTGGAERLILGLTARTDRTEFDVHLCAIGCFGHDTLLRDFEQLEIPFHIISTRRFYEPRTIIALIRYLRDQHIDLIHTHLLYADILGRLIGYLLGIPVVSTLQNDPRDNHNVRIDKRWLSWLTARFTPTHLVAVSGQIRRRFLEQWRLQDGRISTIYNAVQMEPFLTISEASDGTASRGDKGEEQLVTTGVQPLTVTTIGRLEPQKGQHLLLAAAQQVLASYGNVRFLIVGQGALEEQLRTQAVDLQIAASIDFAGLQRNIPEILAQTDIFILPSLWEGLPLAAIEAMAAARPVILTDVGGNQELITHGREGLLIPPEDAAAITTALLELVRDPERRSVLGQRARVHARQHFHIDIITRQYEALYRRLCQQRQGQGHATPGRPASQVFMRSAHE